MCIITGCSNPSVAHGLCAKHYMRQRRAGVAAWPRNDDPYSAIVDSTFPEWSKRTRERFYYATRTLKYIEQTPGYEEIAQQITQCATRPNGSLNVSFLEREAHRIISRRVAAAEVGALRGGDDAVKRTGAARVYRQALQLSNHLLLERRALSRCSAQAAVMMLSSSSSVSCCGVMTSIRLHVEPR